MRNNVDVRARRLGLRGAKKQNAAPKRTPAKVSKLTPAPLPAGSEKAAIGVQNDTGTGSRLDTTIYISGVGPPLYPIRRRLASRRRPVPHGRSSSGPSLSSASCSGQRRWYVA
jgi:hypothetical protein